VVSWDWCVAQTNRGNFQNDWNGEGRPLEDEVGIGHHSSNCVDRLGIIEVLCSPELVIIDCNPEPIGIKIETILNAKYFR
jgi:hypothetical protein